MTRRLLGPVLSPRVSAFSNQSKEAFADWARHDDAQDHFCELDGEDGASPWCRREDEPL